MSEPSEDRKSSGHADAAPSPADRDAADEAAASATATARSRVRSWRRYRLNMLFSSQPQFCCGCLCLAADDARRLRRVFALVRAVVKAARRPGAGGGGVPAAAPMPEPASDAGASPPSPVLLAPPAQTPQPAGRFSSFEAFRAWLSGRRE